jgi:hypothetical protein
VVDTVALSPASRLRSAGLSSAIPDVAGIHFTVGDGVVQLAFTETSGECGGR